MLQQETQTLGMKEGGGGGGACIAHALWTWEGACIAVLVITDGPCGTMTALIELQGRKKSTTLPLGHENKQEKEVIYDLMFPLQV